MGVEQRASVRVPCEFPLRILVGVDPIPATVIDISRRGLRFRIAGRELGVHRLSSLVRVAREVTSRFGETFVVELHPDRVGGLVRKTLTLARIGQRDWESADVEVVCALDPDVTDEEVGLMGISVPGIGETEDPAGCEGAARPPVGAASPAPSPAGTTEPSFDAFDVPAGPAPSTRTVTEQWRVHVYPSSDNRSQPFVARTEHFTSDQAMLRVTDLSLLELPDVEDVAALVVALDQAYGSNIAIKITDGDRHVWTGPCTVRSVELIRSDPPQALIGVGFRRALRSAELQQMGLA